MVAGREAVTSLVASIPFISPMLMSIEHQVRLERLRHRHGLLAGSGLTDEIELGDPTEDGPRSGAERGLVVDHQHLHHGLLGLLLTRL